MQDSTKEVCLCSGKYTCQVFKTSFSFDPVQNAYVSVPLYSAVSVNHALSSLVNVCDALASQRAPPYNNSLLTILLRRFFSREQLFNVQVILLLFFCGLVSNPSLSDHLYIFALSFCSFSHFILCLFQVLLHLSPLPEDYMDNKNILG